MNPFLGREVLRGFIVFEGIDASGKNTQARILAKRLHGTSGASERRGVHTTGEPTTLPSGKRIREVLGGTSPLPRESLYILYAADRFCHLYDPRRGVLRALRDRNQWVVSTRYIYSSFAYQRLNTEYDQIEAVNRFFPLPEILVYIDIGVDLCCERLQRRGKSDIFERRQVLERVHGHYQEIIEQARASQTKVCVIDGSGAVDAIAETIWDALAVDLSH